MRLGAAPAQGSGNPTNQNELPIDLQCRRNASRSIKPNHHDPQPCAMKAILNGEFACRPVSFR